MRPGVVRAVVLVLLGAGLLASGDIGHAQPGRRTPRIGVLQWNRCLAQDAPLATALARFGHRPGETVEVVCHAGESDYGRLSAAAATLVASRVDVIAALTHITAYAASQATRTIPIVMMASGDPVASGLVASLARPGGNVTGLTYYSAELVEKRLQLLKEMVPGLVRVGVLGNPQSDHVFGMYRADAERAAQTLQLQPVKVDAGRSAELDGAFDRMARERVQALLVLTDPALRDEARRIVELAAQHRLPAMYWGPWFVEAGGLAAYGADYDGMVARAAYYVDRILRGARAADLPVEQPTRFELLINTKTARTLGLTVPPSLLGRADRLLD